MIPPANQLHRQRSFNYGVHAPYWSTRPDEPPLALDVVVAVNRRVVFVDVAFRFMQKPWVPEVESKLSVVVAVEETVSCVVEASLNCEAAVVDVA